ncbi:MAG TPA: ParB N-terminal domain-containing protein [Gemmatimonadales bacterium]|jgi:hypothetical protein|nr:ParB N-terminal domain-containing protein [Gemmatimonadales bacterium]
MEQSALKVRRVPLDSLHLDPANARSHGPENMDAIVASLRRFGQAEPLVVQKKTGRVIGGNGRLVAMKKLGLTECDVVELDVDDITATALGIALNRTSELASWDEPALAKILEELRAEDALDGVGYSPEDIDALLADLQDADSTPAEVDDQGPEEPPEKPVSRVSDLWLLGNHRLLCGDSTKAEDLARLMGGEKAALLSTDPPYCVDYTGDNRPIHDGKRSGKDWSHVYREVDIKDLATFLDSVQRHSGARHQCGPHLHLARSRPAARPRPGLRAVRHPLPPSHRLGEAHRSLRPQLLPVAPRALRLWLAEGPQAGPRPGAAEHRLGGGLGWETANHIVPSNE